jgi:hypothetical protein
MTREYTSAISRGGNVTNPQKIIITDTHVIWKQNRGWTSLYLASDSKVISRSHISSIVFQTHLLGTTIIIESYGGSCIYAEKFTLSDAKEIRKTLIGF